jgi:hypothetical protein
MKMKDNSVESEEQKEVVIKPKEKPPAQKSRYESNIPGKSEAQFDNIQVQKPLPPVAEVNERSRKPQIIQKEDTYDSVIIYCNIFRI